MSNNANQQPSKVQPTYVLKIIRKDSGSYGTKVGVTFETGRGNQRIVWDVIPNSIELSYGTLILVPYADEK